MKSKYPGKCSKDSTHTWNIGDEIFISKGPDDKWIKCIDNACYVSQRDNKSAEVVVDVLPGTDALTALNLKVDKMYSMVSQMHEYMKEVRQNQ